MSQEDLNTYSLLKERFEFLFEPELLKEISLSSKLMHFEADNTIMDFGQMITHMPLVLSGSIRVMREDDEGHELLLYYLEVGDTCAVTLTCCSRKSKSKIRAITESQVDLLFIPVEKMEEWMVAYSSWRNFVLESYNIRLDELLTAIDNLAFNNMNQRLILYLKEKVWVTKNAALRITHQQIANDLNSSRVVISRLMKKLEHQGLVKQRRNEIQVLNAF